MPRRWTCPRGRSRGLCALARSGSVPGCAHGLCQTTSTLSLRLDAALILGSSWAAPDPSGQAPDPTRRRGNSSARAISAAIVDAKVRWPPRCEMATTTWRRAARGGGRATGAGWSTWRRRSTRTESSRCRLSRRRSSVQPLRSKRWPSPGLVLPAGGVGDNAWVISAASAICASLLARADSAGVNGSLVREKTNKPVHGEGILRVVPSSTSRSEQRWVSRR